MFAPFEQPKSQPQPPAEEGPPQLPQFNVDQLNQHVLLTVQAVNQTVAVVTVRGA